MKLRKILASFLAGAIAMTSTAVMSVTASAEAVKPNDVTFDLSKVSMGTSEFYTYDTETQVITYSAGWKSAGIWIGSNDHSYYDSVVVEYSELTDASMFQVIAQYTNGSENSVVTVAETSGTVTVDLTDEGKVGGIAQIMLQTDTAGSVKIDSISINASDSAPSIYNKWEKDSNGAYTWLANNDPVVGDTGDGAYNDTKPEQLAISPLDYIPEGCTASDVTKVSVTITITGYAGGSVGLSYPIADDPGYYYDSASIASGTAIVFDTTLGVFEDQNILVNIDWINYGAKINVEVDIEATPSTVPVTGVTVTPATATLEIGDTATLTAKVAPDNATVKTVTWSSSDESVATVADGVVTAKAAGTATIKAKTTDGEFTAACAVTVNAEEEPTPEEPTPDTPTESDTVVWEGSTDLGTSWGANVSVADIEASEGDTLKITYTVGTAATYQQLKIMDGSDGWPALSSPTVNEWDSVDLTATSTSYEVALNAKDVAAITTNGLVVSGYNVTITKIEIIPDQTTKFDQTSTAFTEGTIVAQTATEADGEKSLRFVKKVSKEDTKGKTTATFSIKKAGVGTALLKATACYEAVPANGTTVPAGDGYVFLVITIVNVPAEDVAKLSCDGVTLS